MAQPAAPAAATAPTAGPVVPKLASFSVEGDYRVTFAVDLELKIDEPELRKTLPLDDVPLPGTWSVIVEREGDKVKFTANHGALPLERSDWERKAAPSLNPKVNAPYTGYVVSATPRELATASVYSNRTLDPATQRKYRLTFELRQAGLFRTAARSEPKDCAERLPDFGLRALPNDVRLFFPRVEGRPEAELWTSEDLLVRSSPYFRVLFSSGLAETVPVRLPRADEDDDSGLSPPSERLSAPEGLVATVAGDSDDETDRVDLERSSRSLHDMRKDGAFSYKQVVVTQAAYSTYRAVLLWMQTGYIAFAPLSSSFGSAGASTGSRSAALETANEEHPSLPLPVSPKSVYRLAHILELDALEAHALEHFRKTCLTLETAPVELFSELSRDHAPWRAAILDWVVEHYDAVKKTDTWKEMKRRVANDEIDRVGTVLWELTDKLDERRR